MELFLGKSTFYASSSLEWRNWLEINHLILDNIWLIIYKKDSKIPSVYYPEAVDEALCFGWVDSAIRKRDKQSYYQYFSKRNPKSNWSKVNKEKIEKLIKLNKISDYGYKVINISKENGCWNALDDIENLVLPIDLLTEFELNLVALQNWNNFPKSAKRGILEWLFNAKKNETRQKRIKEIIENSLVNKLTNFPNK